MKVGLISDIHGNVLALEKVYEEFKKNGVNNVLCAGDIIGLGPHPDEVVEFLKKQDNLYAVRGNHEGYLLDGIPKIIHSRKMTDEETRHHKWIHGRLSEGSKSFLASLPKEQYFKFENKKIYMAHYPISEFGIYKEFIKEPSLEESKRLFGDIDADIFIYGHTHIFSKNETDNKLFLNLESLGCPLKTNFAKAYILTIENDIVNFTPLNVEYEVDKVKKEIMDLKYSFYESVLKIFY